MDDEIAARQKIKEQKEAMAKQAKLDKEKAAPKVGEKRSKPPAQKKEERKAGP